MEHGEQEMGGSGKGARGREERRGESEETKRKKIK